MPYPYSNVVDDPYGPRHEYGSTIWDVFRPRPQDEQQTQENLLAQGYLGQDVSQVQEQGSPFRRLLQGIGVMNAPSPRALTPYEQFLYQKGLHMRGQEDLQTEEGRIRLLQSEENLGQDVAKTGQMPSGAPWNLPQGMMPGFANVQQDYTNTQDYMTKKRQADLESEDALKREREQRLKYNEYILDQQREQKHMDMLKKWTQTPAMQSMIKEYEDYRKQAVAEPNSIKKSGIISQMQGVQARMKNWLAVHAVPTHDISDADAELLSNLGADTFAPFTKQAVEPRLVPDAAGVHQGLEELGIIDPSKNMFGAP
jgi:hypothetical protein